MRKLGVRSIRAPALVRIKLIELHSLPSHSPVCALILLSEAENLVRSFHLPVPNVVYETFLRSPLSAVSMHEMKSTVPMFAHILLEVMVGHWTFSEQI